MLFYIMHWGHCVVLRINVSGLRPIWDTLGARDGYDKSMLIVCRICHKMAGTLAHRLDSFFEYFVPHRFVEAQPCGAWYSDVAARNDCHAHIAGDAW